MCFVNAIVNVKKNFSKTSKINIQLIAYLREEDQLLKFRNKFIAKRIGTKTLASLLAFGMALGSPMAAFADDGETAVVAENTVQAKKTDGSEAFVSVSDYVRGMMESGAVRLNNETGYLEDTSTGQKVDPETGERLTETPDVPETPAIPDTPGNQENPESPGTPENPENPEVPEKPDTPGTPETPEKPDTPETPGTPEKPDTPENPDSPDSGKSDSKDPIQTPDTDKADSSEDRKDTKTDPIPGSEIDHTQEISKAEEAARDGRGFPFLDCGKKICIFQNSDQCTGGNSGSCRWQGRYFRGSQRSRA